MTTRQAALSLYRRSLKLALDWAVHRHLWRGQALYIRSLFEANKKVTDPRQQRALLAETEKLLESWKHPDPYVPPTAPGGSKFERNLPSPILDRERMHSLRLFRLLIFDSSPTPREWALRTLLAPKLDHGYIVKNNAFILATTPVSIQSPCVCNLG
ncbi:hypothetical protein Trisim1_011520 [Trichoderma cf. simile WF8]